MQENPFTSLEKLDPKLAGLLDQSRSLAFTDGALPRKYKLLVALALQSAHLADEAIKSFAGMALQAGATREEIAEVLRVVQYINGVGGVLTAASALQHLL